MKIYILSILSLFSILLSTYAQETKSKLSAFNQQVDKQINIRQNDEPRIGISSSNYTGGASVSGAYIESVLKSGGEPIINHH